MKREGLWLLLFSSQANSQKSEKIKVRSDGQERLKAQDNRDNVGNMLKKLLRVRGETDITQFDILQTGCWCQLLSPDGWEKSNKGDALNSMDRACRKRFQKINII